MVTIRVRLSAIALVCVALLPALPVLAATADKPLDVTALEAAGPYHVVIVHSPLDEDLTDDLVISTGAAALSGLAGAAVTTAGMAGAATSMTIGSTTYYSTAATIMAPAAVLIGAGAFAGVIQQKNAERREARRFAIPIQERAAAAHAAEGLDRSLEGAVSTVLASLPWFQSSGPITTVQAEDDPWGEALGVRRHDGARALLVISVAARLPDSLAGYYQSIEVRIYSDALPRRSAAWSKAGRYAWSSGAATVVSSPVSLVDIGRKPQPWIDAQTMAVNAKYDALIAASKNRDTQRELRTRRNAELERVAGPWRITQLAEYMAPHWAPAEGDRYISLVRDGQGDLVRLVADSLAAAAGSIAARGMDNASATSALPSGE